ncbi:signal-transducing adaptor protein 2-like isoform X1 [Micropterus salmoides]|uniref:signal-transducing adaptor protein 2-like isoform X1 n=1 Tax=Micropterus salmoides TaxID=27706 RepID=UPI0018EC3BF7|nr:signal-transducing adaptor protein 2-like isoform X1 [Micropterus salmoides]
MAKRPGRQRNQLPTCYYEGYLEKRSFREKTSRKLWTCLCGSTLFFFNEKRDADYIEKLDLSGFISITDDGSYDRNLGAARLNFQMKDENIKFTCPNAETRELWKGFIHSVAKLSLPSSLNLLPGQIQMLKEVIEKEKERIKTVPPSAVSSNSSPYISLQAEMPVVPPPAVTSSTPHTSLQADMPAVPLPAVTNSSPYIHLQADLPACYHNVSRLEAELLLEREAKRGNLLLRPGRDGQSFAVSTRQDLGGSIFRHYRVTRKHAGGFTIDVDNPVLCATLHDVIDYLVDKTDGVLSPLSIEEQYEKNIYFIWSDDENGEKSVQQAQSAPPSIPPKPVALRPPILVPVPEQPVEDNLYLNDTLEEMEKEPEESPDVPLQPLEKKAPKKAMMPPSHALCKRSSSASFSSSSSSTNSWDMRMKVPSESLGQIPPAAISELKLKLERKGMCQE